MKRAVCAFIVLGLLIAVPVSASDYSERMTALSEMVEVFNKQREAFFLTAQSMSRDEDLANPDEVLLILQAQQNLIEALGDAFGNTVGLLQKTSKYVPSQ